MPFSPSRIAFELRQQQGTFRSITLFATILLIAAGSLLTESCSNLFGNQTKATSNSAVQITPGSADLSSGDKLQLTAAVSGTPNTAVTWSTTTGTISSAGLFTAPSVTATTSATVTVSLKDTNSSSPMVSTATIWIRPAGTSSKLQIGSSALASGTYGLPYTTTLVASGGTPPYQWSLSSGALPPGLALSASAGIISGTPTQSGQFSFGLSVTDASSQSIAQTESLTVSSNQSSGNFDGPAELPRVYLNSAMANTPSSGRVISVASNGNFQSALDSAACGDTIELQAGATYTGLFTVPAKSCDDNHWIIIRSNAADSSLPPEGSRVTPCYAGVTSLPGRPALHCTSSSNVLAKLSYGGAAGSGPIQLASGANRYRFVGLEITRAAGSGYTSSLVSTQGSGTADRIVVDRVWLHGTATDDTATGVALGGMTNTAIINSYLTDFHCTSAVGSCTDAHAIGGGVGSTTAGPYQITGNFLEASGENVLFGGGAATTTPADIQINQNHFYKPLIWLSGQPGFVGGTGGHPFVVKNHLELKNAQRVLIEGNIFEYSWGGFSQAGNSILLTPKNQYDVSSKTNICPLCQVTDVTIRFNTISHVAAGFQIANALSDGGGSASAGQRYSIHDVIVDDMDQTKYAGGGGLMQVSNNWTSNVLNNVSVNHVTAFPDSNSHALLLGNLDSNPQMSGFTFTNSIVTATKYPVWNAFGNSTSCAAPDVPNLSLPACFTTYSFTHNAMIATPSGFPASSWPIGNYFPTGPSAVQFVNYNNGNGGDYHLLSSSPYKNAGTDGLDLGADVDAVLSAIAGVY